MKNYFPVTLGLEILASIVVEDKHQKGKLFKN